MKRMRKSDIMDYFITCFFIISKWMLIIVLLFLMLLLFFTMGDFGDE